MPLELSLHPRKTSVLADGPIPLSLELKNAGAGDARVLEPGGLSPFEYALYSADGSSLLQSASEMERRDADPWLADDPPVPRDNLALPPGGAAVYEDDLMSFLMQPLEPGSYLLQASYLSSEGEICTSPRVALEVVISRPQTLAQDLSPEGGRVTIAEWHRTPEGTTVLRERGAGLPPLGRFFDLQTFETAGPLRQSAMSLNAAYRIPEAWRWLAWLDGERLFAGVAHAGTWLYPTTTVSLDLQTPTLLPYGYTLHDAGAIFLVAGRRGDRAHLQLVRIPPGYDVTPVSTDVRLEDPPDTVPSATCVWTESGPPELLLSWIVCVHDVQLILFGRVDALTGEVLSPPKGVYPTLRSVAAFAVPPALGTQSSTLGEQRSAQVLLAPASPGSPYTHVTFDMLNPSTSAARDLPLLPELASGGVDRWVLPSALFPGVPVLAVAGQEIWMSGSRAWTGIAAGNIDPSSVRLWAFSPTRWICSWFDRTHGYRWRPLRAGEG